MSVISKVKGFIKYIKRKDIVGINVPILEGSFLKDKYALIIGGTGGIGEAIVNRFVENGCFCYISGTNESKLKELKDRFLDKVCSIKLNLNNIDEISKTIEHVFERSEGKIDILVNAAGIHGASDFWEIKEEDFDSVIDINVKSVYFSSLFFARKLKDMNRKGHIINISSASALKPGRTPYEISKNAVRSLTLGFSQELVKYGIICNSIAPGPVATKMLKCSNDASLNWEGNPTGRMASPEEIANWVLLLASDLGNLIVGDSIYVSGGSGTICIDK